MLGYTPKEDRDARRAQRRREATEVRAQAKKRLKEIIHARDSGRTQGIEKAKVKRRAPPRVQRRPAGSETDFRTFAQENSVGVVMGTDVPRGREFVPLVSWNLLPGTLRDSLDASFYRRFPRPTTIQAAVFPFISAGYDVLGISETGSGKTLAYLLPVVHLLMARGAGPDTLTPSPEVIIVSPTVELALQIRQVLADDIGYPHSMAVTGRENVTSVEYRLSATEERIRVLIGTVGTLTTLVESGSVSIERLRTLVVDEVEQVGSMEINELFSMLGTVDGLQTCAFSASVSIRALGKVKQKIWPNSASVCPTIVTVAKIDATSRIEQRLMFVKDKKKAVRDLVEGKHFRLGGEDLVIVFCNTSESAKSLAADLGFEVIYGKMPKKDRQEAFESFISGGSGNVLVATDLIARGIDVPDVRLVIQYDVPTKIDTYVNRVGRTGRAGRRGRSVLLVSPKEKVDPVFRGALVKILRGNRWFCSQRDWQAKIEMLNSLETL